MVWETDRTATAGSCIRALKKASLDWLTNRAFIFQGSFNFVQDFIHDSTGISVYLRKCMLQNLISFFPACSVERMRNTLWKRPLRVRILVDVYAVTYFFFSINLSIKSLFFLVTRTSKNGIWPLVSVSYVNLLSWWNPLRESLMEFISSSLMKVSSTYLYQDDICENN